MNVTTPEHVTETLHHLYSHWESRRKAADAQRRASLPPGELFTIALAREAGTQGTLIAREVGNRLGWQVYDHELLERIAVDMGLRTALLESLDERRQSWLLETAKAFLSAPTKGEWGAVTESAYVHHLIKVILALGVYGECVIVGRGASFILPAKTTLRVRLIGPVRDRVATWSHNLGVSEREAAQQVRTIDRERADFVQDHFFKDPADPRNYDLLLNVARFSVARSAEVIAEALHRLAASRDA
jgi:cytidylate kinase